MKHVHAIVCNSPWSKARGLMFSSKKSLVFAFDKDKHVPLHMMFVFFPIDVYYLNANKQVIEVKKNFKPFTFYTPKNKARFVLEVPSPSSFSVGDVVSFKSP